MNQIKELRQSTGLSQTKFGQALGGIPLRTLQDWEHGKRTPLEWAVKLITFRVENDPQFNKRREGCEFCNNFDFTKACATTEKGARIELAICNTQFPADQQFNYCPVCGKELKKR